MPEPRTPSHSAAIQVMGKAGTLNGVSTNRHDHPHENGGGQQGSRAAHCAFHMLCDLARPDGAACIKERGEDHRRLSNCRVVRAGEQVFAEQNDNACKSDQQADHFLRGHFIVV